MLFGTAKPIVLTLGVSAVLAVGGVAVPLTALADDPAPTTGAEPTPSDSPTSDPTPTPTPTPDPEPTDSPTSAPADPPPPVVEPAPPPPPAPPGSQTTGSQPSGGSSTSVGSSTVTPSRAGTTAALAAPSVQGPAAVTLMHAMPAGLGTLGAGAALPFAASGPGRAPLVALPGGQPPQLPLVGPAPAVAPKLGQQGTPTALRAVQSPLGTDDMTYRLILIQLAWLSALLVFLSMLLTQLRLKRRGRARLDA